MKVTARRLLAVAIALMVALTFAWPADAGLDPSSPAYRWAALGALAAFLAGLVLALAARVRK